VDLSAGAIRFRVVLIGAGRGPTAECAAKGLPTEAGGSTHRERRLVGGGRAIERGVQRIDDREQGLRVQHDVVVD